ncbi:lung seven transmembrane receptor-domain-containing protein [Lobosporangium transversale]|uniref:Lung seven transmembrane receptor-domain-containing protein n=1 Tax=Lobosporangium transversale TaxID=64571 RepID=A0A1Y2H6P9_9FUNG|nr:lung seven transmembrane receptor-domain-containing protein [Lobosporangium transversale]ORZ28732.1 lung seven transmembrane receptor-domain-containing protein [Lobosporangium transversale]|eukprot:XP_021886405.1 lung seven transmembrane receptor-domain-containing protein [Lobosporangium transversale]
MASSRGKLLSILLTLSLLLNLTCTDAFRAIIDSDLRKFGCAGMYGSSPGTNDSEIRVVMDKSSKGNAVVVIFEWNDNKYVGKTDPEDGKPIYICDTDALKAGLCNEGELGHALIDTSVESTVRSATFNFTEEEQKGIQYYQYHIEKTGYYCVMAWPVQVNQEDAYFQGVLDFKNKYGTLAGSDFPKLPFYGVLSLIYMTIGISWMVLCAKHWREILMVQHFISGVIFFLMVEMAFNWGYWDDYNKTGQSSMALLVIVSILNSGRNSISLFMLLIVSMGYGVVKPTLGSTMKKVIILSSAHFLFGIIYSAGTMSPVDDISAMIVLMVVVPLALTMTSFYIWTLQSLTSTIATLNLRRQTEKVKMYTRLWRLLVFSLTVLCAFFVINTLNFMNADSDDWPATHWRIQWFLLDGWLNVLYLIVFTVIVILWRPTENNKIRDRSTGDRGFR